MEIESSLDENFIFYLDFVASFLRQIQDTEVRRKCESWVRKLLSEQYDGVDRKRWRNIYLSQLLICMQTGELTGVFCNFPDDVDLSNAFNDFQLTLEDEKNASWLNDSNVVLNTADQEPRKGRTYLATRTLPNGRGAMAYVAVSMGDEAPIWLGSGEGLNQHMEDKYKEYVPEYEMEKILAKRKDPKEREKVVTYYKVILQNIEDEMEGKVEPEKNEDVNKLLAELVIHLQNTGGFGRFEEMSPIEQRAELLTLLFGHINNKIENSKRLEETLGEIEAKMMAKSFFENVATESDQAKLPANMWEQVINKAPGKKHIDRLHSNYPIYLVEKYLELLSNHKEETAVRIQRRYENIITQMKKEVQKEGERGKQRVAEAQQNYDDVAEVLRCVKDAYEKQMKISSKNNDNGHSNSDQSKVFEEMRIALIDTQKRVEEEAQRGKQLAGQINYINQQTEVVKEVNNQRIHETEEANLAVMSNIKKLNTAIKQYHERIKQIETYSKNARSKEGRGQYVEFL